ncbi:hypothetical protein HK405_002217, partial [Cladochytrium tenue]
LMAETSSSTATEEGVDDDDMDVQADTTGPTKDKAPEASVDEKDSHSLAEGVIIIMTTNHSEVLDWAVVRPGRIDLHFSLGHCTRHQLERMYKNVVEDDSAALEP